jgi:PhzF family phenazine biosynthesis protein
MKTIKVYHYDAFSSIPHKGNPAGVVLNGDELNEAEMLEIAKKVGFNETAFVLNSDKADLRIRYFTPGHEINLCGHGTMATLYSLKEKGLLCNKTDLTIETKAGVLAVHFNSHSNDELYISMKQATPQFQRFNGSYPDLALSMGIESDEIDMELPTLYGSTGTWTLLIPIKHLDTFKRMKPDNKLFPDILQEMPRVSLHPFCLETYDPNAHMHARHFSSPYSGTIEDPVTGTASGVMGSYYATYINKSWDSSLNLVVEQGQEIGRDGRVQITVTGKDPHNIEITGTAVYLDEFEISI